MSQHDFSVSDNQSFPAYGVDLNNALQSLVTISSGINPPATPYALMFWADTAAGVLKQRNSSNSAWIFKGVLDEEHSGYGYIRIPNTWSQQQTFSGGIFFGTGQTNLNVYREIPTFTPSIQATTTNWFTIEYGTRTGTYSRVGNTVHFGISLEITNLVGTPAGNVIITGLPSLSHPVIPFGLQISSFPAADYGSGYTFVTARTINSTNIDILRGGSSNQIVAFPATSLIPGTIRVSGTYIVP